MIRWKGPRLLPLLATALAAAGPWQASPASGAPAQLHLAEQPPGPTAATLTVRGEARLGARPDLATVRLGVWARGATAREAQESVARAARQVVEALMALEMAPAELQTQGLSLQPVWRHNERTRETELTGYEALYSLKVDVADLARVGEVVDAAVRSGANRIDSISFTVRDAATLKEQALQQAVADGVRQARALAAAAGIRLGPLRRIGDVQFGGPPVVRPVAPLRAAAEVAVVTPVEPGVLEFSASVELVYEIGPAESPPP